MIYVVKKLNETKPFCITCNLDFAKFVVLSERKNDNELCYFECKDMNDVALLVSEEYAKSVEMFYAEK